MLVAQGLVKDFSGHRAVDGISFTIAQGTITGLIGPNGAGKTTLFNLLAGAMTPTAGSLLFRDRRIDGLRPDQISRLGIGRTFQIPRPFPEMTVLENVMLAPHGQAGESVLATLFAPRRVALQERQVRDRAMHWIDFVGLGALAAQEARVLSGGQRKLLELARVMVQEPSLLLLDEPGAGVAPALLDVIMARIAELNRSGVTVLVIEHNMDLVMSLCDPVLVMASGRLLASGSGDAVRRDPRVVEAYLGGYGA